MKKYLLFLLLFLSAIANAQTKIVPVKKNGQYVAPMFNPITGAVSDVIVDSVNFWKPPIVVPPLPIDDTTKIDGRNGTFVGTWTQATGAGNGWYKNTLSYSNVANNTVTYKFQGTKLELWGEKKQSHGTGVITLKLGATVIETKTVSFVGSTLLPALIYTSPNLTPLRNYTIELKVTSGWNLIDFLTIWNYAQSTAGPDPIDPLPPNPGEILIQPGQDINNIIKALPRGSNVRLAAGNHTVGKLSIPDGVNFRGSGKANTTIHASGSYVTNSQDAMLNLKSGAGGQIISDFTLHGQNTASCGFFIDRDNVSVLNVKVTLAKFVGGWVWDTDGFKTYELDLIDNSWSDVGWCSGELALGGHMRNADIEIGLIQTTSNARGYAVKILWDAGDVNTNKLENVKIHGGRIDLMHYSRWNNGQSRNLGIEYHNVDIIGVCEVYDMVMENQMSFSLQRENPGKIKVYNCIFKLEGDTYAIEHIMNNLDFYDCQIMQAGMILANFKRNIKCDNALVNNITFTEPNGTAMYGGLVYVGEAGCSNVVIRNSRIDQLPGMPLTTYRSDPKTGVTYESSNTIY